VKLPAGFLSKIDLAEKTSLGATEFWIRLSGLEKLSQLIASLLDFTYTD
jgi:hypothetical protein